jgi:aldehyde:ferredoxin oxidoreductase
VAWAKNEEGALLSSEAFRAIAKRFWGDELAVDFSTYEGKALAAKKIQDRETAKECLILCDFLWPIMEQATSEDHVGDPTLESKIVSAVIGKEVDEKGLYEIGARVFNLQRAVLVREGGYGRDFDYPPDLCFSDPLQFDNQNPDCLMPGKDGEIISRKGAVLERKEFERMRDEYYALRQWDLDTGFQTRQFLEALNLSDVVEDLEKRGKIGKSFVETSFINIRGKNG